jgi:hypothetical protein
MEYYDGEQKRWLPVTPSKAPTATQQHAANATGNGSLMKNSSFVAHLYSNPIDGVNNLPINSNHGKRTRISIEIEFLTVGKISHSRSQYIHIC